MKITINGHDFEGATWNAIAGTGIMRYETDESIVTIIGEIGENNDIEVYDDEDVLTAKWYNAGVLNVNEYKSENAARAVEIVFAVSILDSNAEEQLQAGIDESVEGIFELAEYISDLETEHTETRRRIDLYTKSVEDTAKDFETKHADTNDKFAVKDAQISDLVTAVNAVRDDLTATQASIANIPSDVIQRFAELWNRYNDLADRVARLENAQ